MQVVELGLHRREKVRRPDKQHEDGGDDRGGDHAVAAGRPAQAREPHHRDPRVTALEAIEGGGQLAERGDHGVGLDRADGAPARPDLHHAHSRVARALDVEHRVVPHVDGLRGSDPEAAKREQEDLRVGLPDPALVGEGQHRERRQKPRAVEHRLQHPTRRPHGIGHDGERQSPSGQRRDGRRRARHPPPAARAARDTRRRRPARRGLRPGVGPAASESTASSTAVTWPLTSMSRLVSQSRARRWPATA